MSANARTIHLHARHEHGGFPVKATPSMKGGYSSLEVLWPDGPHVYPSTRQMLRALYNKGNTDPKTARDPGMTFDRYFRVGSYAPVEDNTEGPDIFDLFLNEEPPKQPPSLSVETSALTATNPTISVETSACSLMETGLSVDPTVKLGIDLHNRAHEVRKLLFAGFGSRIFHSGYNPEDVLQEVYKGILARNIGTCQFDPRKSSFGHYVHMVCGCILANYHRKQNRRAANEQVGMYTPGQGGDEKGHMVDAALAAKENPQESASFTEPEARASETRAIHSLQEYVLASGHGDALSMLASECVPMVYMGYSRGEIAREIGLEPSKIGKALAYTRSVARDWGKKQNAP